MNNKILSIIAAGESEEVEFKTSFSKDAIETLCAFANSQGGTLLVGVEDSRKIAGVTCGPETVQTWMNQTKQSTMPSLIPNVELARISHNI